MTVFLDRLFAVQGSCIPACSPPRPAHPVPVPVPVPKLGSKSPPPPAEPQLLHSGVATCIGRRIQLSRPAALLQDPLAPLPPPLASAPRWLRCTVLHCKQVFSAIVHGPRVQSVRVSGGSRRSSCTPAGCRAPGGFRGAPAGYACRRFSRDPGFRPKTPALEPSARGDQGSRPHLLGPATQCPFRHPRCCCFSLPIHALSSACPDVPPPSCKLVWSGCCLALGLLLSHQGLLTI